MTEDKTKKVIKASEEFDYSQLSHLLPMMGMRSISEVKDWLNMLVYGPFGDGKTHLLGTAALVPEMRDILYLSLEGGEKTMKVIAKIMRDNNVDPDCIMVMPIQTYKQYAGVYKALIKHVEYRDSNNVVGLRKIECQLRGIELLRKIGWQPKGSTPEEVVKEMGVAVTELMKDDKRLAELIPEPKKFNTVITDSLSEAQKYCMYQILGIDPLKQALDIEPESAQWGDWGASREMIQFLVRRFRDLPIHSLFVCGVNEDEDIRKRKYYTPMLPGKLSGDVRGLVDVVGFLKKIPQENNTVARRLFLEGGDYGASNIAAKHRFGPALKGNFIDNPTMADLYRLNESANK